MRKRALHFALEQDIYTCYGKRACRLVTGKGHVDLSLEKCIYIYIYTCHGKGAFTLVMGKGHYTCHVERALYLSFKTNPCTLHGKGANYLSFGNGPGSHHEKMCHVIVMAKYQQLVIGKLSGYLSWEKETQHLTWGNSIHCCFAMITRSEKGLPWTRGHYLS